MEHFGPIGKISIALKRYLLLIGTQASGKSTLAKLIAIFRKKEFVLTLFDDKEGGKDAMTFFKDYNIHNYFSSDPDRPTRLQYSGNDYQIVFENDSWNIRLSDEFKDKIIAENERVRNVITLFVKGRAGKNGNAHADHEEEAIRQLHLQNRHRLFSSELFKNPVYIPTERSLVAMIQDASFWFTKVPLPAHFMEFGQKFQAATTGITEYDIPFLDIAFKQESGGLKVYFDERRSLLLAESASGIQAIYPLMIVVEHAKQERSTFVVEEPELNLYPKAQKKLMAFLVGSTNFDHSKSDLVITTHSPYLLSILNNYLYAHTVGTKNAANRIAVNEVLPEAQWIDPNDLAAYFIGPENSGSDAAGVASIINLQTGLISENELDAISEDIASEFDRLIDINLGR